MSVQVLTGDCRELLPTLPAESVQCVITSPPYWLLRDYNTAGQIGLEPTLAEYLDTMVDVFREVRRVLRPDGTVWLNMGDGYNAYNGGAGPNSGRISLTQSRVRPHLASGYGLQNKALKPKDLMMGPHRLAIALQDDGWWVRADIVWAKPNPMPESVRDRPTRSHEYVFLLAKNERYYYDADVIAEPTTGHAPGTVGNASWHKLPPETRNGRGGSSTIHTLPAIRNKRDVWTIPPEPFSGAHFATFPEKLVEPCILAGSRPGDTVLDPFAGSGTTPAVALRLRRSAIGIELNPEYVTLIHKRLSGITLPLPLEAS